jgi:hypothetical protein
MGPFSDRMEKKDGVSPPVGVKAWNPVGPGPIFHTTIGRTENDLKIESVTCQRKTFLKTIYSLHSLLYGVLDILS